jgi:hypothetical protein
MNNILLKTDSLQQYWLDCRGTLESYYNELTNSNFESAKQVAEKLGALVNDYEKSGTNNHPDEFYNDCFIFDRFASLLNRYAQYWSQICDGFYPGSWDTLQDVLNSLRLLKRFSNFDRTSLFKFLERQAQALEPLYPYKFFSSIEAVVSRVDCNICGRNMESLECEHIAGELYRGKLAYGIVKEFKDLLSVALVENPQDKRCKMMAINDKSIPFIGVEYLKDLVSVKKCNPLRISHTDESTRRIKIAENTGADEDCPCGSGKKFKECCFGKDFFERRHVEIVISEHMRLSPDNFVCL